MPSPTEITVPKMSRVVGTPGCPVVIDVRLQEDVADDPTLLPGALPWPHHDIESLIPRLTGKGAIVYCQKGGKVSQGAAALLREGGVLAETLEGGHVAWRDAGQTLVPLAKIPGRDTKGRTRWVTRHRPKIDRLACPWLIRRFVDPQAVFLYVAPSEVLSVADRFDATPFDVVGVHWSHRGETCTFDTMVEEFALQSEAMERLCRIVRGADTNRHDLAPESAGLLAASLGLSRIYRDDLEQLNAAMMLYDAFYRWARDAFDEEHDWPAPGSGG